MDLSRLQQQCLPFINLAPVGEYVLHGVLNMIRKAFERVDRSISR